MVGVMASSLPIDEGMRTMAKDQDWRLRLDLEHPADLEALLADVQDSTAGKREDAPALAKDVVLTHDGKHVLRVCDDPRSPFRARAKESRRHSTGPALRA